METSYVFQVSEGSSDVIDVFFEGEVAVENENEVSEWTCQSCPWFR